MAAISLCIIEGCDKPVRVKARGLCNAHYLRLIRNGHTDARMTLKGEPEAFLKTVVLQHAGDECLIWPFAKNEHGYGRMFAANGETTLVHRRVCEEVNGDPPSPDYEAAHSCGNGHLACVSPRHVRWATAVENADDMIAHGTRFSKARGTAHGLSKLTEDDVRAIRRDRGKSTIAVVADRYGVKPETIKAIYSRRNWGWLD